jgi:nondiscriminating glutamyl-tRNA synthetase
MYWQFIRPFMLQAPNPDQLSEEKLQVLAKLFKEQIPFGQAILPLVQPILQPAFNFDAEATALVTSAEGQKVLALFAEKLSAVSTLEGTAIKDIFKAIQQETGLKGKPLFMPVRLKLTGQLHGAELANIIPILGKDLTLKRLKA